MDLLNVFSNITDILREKANEPKQKTPYMKSVELNELVENIRHQDTKTVLTSLRTPVEAPEKDLIYVRRDDEDEDTLPSLASLSSLDNSTTQPSSVAIHPPSITVDDIDAIQVRFVHLVYQTDDEAYLIKQDGEYTFPIVGLNQSAEEVQALAEKYSATIIAEPQLDSAYLLTNTPISNTKPILKTDIIQRKQYENIRIHPSVWGFYGLYPEYLSDDALYHMRRITDATQLPARLIDNYPVYIMEEDAERFQIEGEPTQYRLGIVGYIDDSMAIDKKIDDFIKEYNNINSLCIRVKIGHRVIPLWIPTTNI